MKYIELLIGAAYMGLFRLRWYITLAAARSAARAYIRDDLTQTLEYSFVVGRVFALEEIGIRHNWMRTDQRTVTSMVQYNIKSDEPLPPEQPN
jgi:hypothetical protein